MPVATPVSFTAEQLDVVQFDAAGLVPAIVQEQGTGEVLMMAWMNADTLRQTLETGRTWFWSRQPPGVLVQGRDLGRPPVRPRRPTTTATATPCCSWSSRRAPAPATPATAPASTGPSGPSPDRRHRDGRARTGTEFRGPGRRLLGRAGVAGAAGRPDHPGGCLRPPVRRRRARVPARVGRARRALGPLVVHGPRPVGHDVSRGRAARPSEGPARRRPRRPGHPGRRRGAAGCLPLAAPRRAAAAARRARRLPGLRRGARGRAPARRPARRPRAPRRRRCRSSASWPPTTTGASG